MTGPRKASVTHCQVLTDPGVQLRRELTVEMLQKTRHDIFACPAGLIGIAHGVDAEEGRWLWESETAEEQCADLMRRKQAWGDTP
jgi:hypothetical protein